MPVALPFAPSASDYAYNRPRITHASDFTGEEQQILTGYPYWSGSLTFPPLTEATVQHWRAFYAELESGDGTFLAPLHTPQGEPSSLYNYGLGSPQGWFRVSGISRREFVREAAVPPVPDPVAPAAGDLMQIAVRDHMDITTCGTLLSISPYVLSGNNFILAEGIGAVARIRSVEVRALITNSDYGELQAQSAREARPNRIEWSEAVGAVVSELYELVA